MNKGIDVKSLRKALKKNPPKLWFELKNEPISDDEKQSLMDLTNHLTQVAIDLDKKNR